MKKLVMLTIGICLLATPIFAATDISSTTSVTVGPVFSVEFYSDPPGDDKTRYDDGQIVFPAYDPAGDVTMIMTSAWADGDGKSDTGAVVRTNASVDWRLQIYLTTTSANLTETNVAVYLPDLVWDRNTGTSYPSGIVKQWYTMPAIGSTQTIYDGTGGLQNTAPFGVLATFGFAVLPTGQATPLGQPLIGTGNVLPEGTHNFAIHYQLVAI